MRIAAQIFKENSIKIGNRNYVNREYFIRSINEARKELLEELANDTSVSPYGNLTYITREEILDYIKEIK